MGPASAERRVLYVPESNQAWDQAYAAVAARLPILSLGSCLPLERHRHISCLKALAQILTTIACGAFAPGWPQVFRLTPLPKGVIDRLAAITDQAVAEVAKQEREMVPSEGHARPLDSTSASPARDRTFLIGPYGLSESGHAWLSLAVVDKELTIACGNALLHFLRNCARLLNCICLRRRAWRRCLVPSAAAGTLWTQ